MHIASSVVLLFREPTALPWVVQPGALFSRQHRSKQEEPPASGQNTYFTFMEKPLNIAVLIIGWFLFTGRKKVRIFGMMKYLKRHITDVNI